MGLPGMTGAKGDRGPKGDQVGNKLFNIL